MPGISHIYRLGIKELWEVPKDRVAPGTVIHTLGYPLRRQEFGGGFIYALPDGMLSVGFVSGLDYRDPMFDLAIRESSGRRKFDGFTGSPYPQFRNNNN